jgi:branched-chain amino acid transport system ATP-binding protein
MILTVQNIDTFYEQSHILFRLSLNVREGEALVILGRNGMGKSTTLKSIMGLASVKSGKIDFDNHEITNRAPYYIARLGIGYVPEDRRIFSELTVRENILIGIKKAGGPTQWTLERVFELFPILKARLDQDGITLSGGEQQMLTIARSLMGNPRLILLDEPSEGLAPLVVKDIRDQLIDLKGTGIAMLLAEQSTALASRVCDRVVVIEKGNIVWHGTVEGFKGDEEMRQRYLAL